MKKVKNMMSENEFWQHTFLNIAKFMFSVGSLFIILGNCFEILNYCVIKQLPLENYVINHLSLKHLLFVMGFTLWLHIKERKLALKVVLILLASTFIGWRLYYFSLDELFVSHTMFIRVVGGLLSITAVLIIAAFTFLKYKARTIYYSIFAIVTALLSYLNYLGTLAYFFPLADYDYISSFLGAAYVSGTASLIYVFEISVPAMYRNYVNIE